MKTLSKRFRFVVLAVIVIVAVVSCCYFPSIPDTRISSYAVEIGSKQRVPPYVVWKGDGTDFYRALKQIRDHKGVYCLCVMKTSNATPQQLNYGKCAQDYKCPLGNIRTVKVTKSKVADDIAAAESAANDPNAMHRIQSSDPGDIKTVLDALEK